MLTLKNRTGQERTGFTIVELLVVIAVIGILAAITLVAYNGITTQAIVASLQSDLNGASKQLILDQSYSSTRTFPATIAAANGGSGLKASKGNSYGNYSTITAVPYFCLAESNGTLQYKISSLNDAPAKGDCATTNGLIGWWPMDGNADDLSGSGVKGTVSGTTPVNGQNSNPSGAYSYPASSYIDLGTPAAFANITSTGFTMSIWLHRTASTPYQYPEIFGSSDTHVFYGIRSENYGDSIAFEYGTSPYSGSSFGSVWFNSSLPLNTWHLATVTYSGGTITTYWDGLYADTATANLVSGAIDFSFGSSDPNGKSFVNGQIDDARIYNRVLSTAEINTLFKAGAE